MTNIWKCSIDDGAFDLTIRMTDRSWFSLGRHRRQCFLTMLFITIVFADEAPQPRLLSGEILGDYHQWWMPGKQVLDSDLIWISSDNHQDYRDPLCKSATDVGLQIFIELKEIQLHTVVLLLSMVRPLFRMRVSQKNIHVQSKPDTNTWSFPIYSSW